MDREDLKFIAGAAPQTAVVPVRVIQAARQQYGLLKAMTHPRQISKWRSLDFRPGDGKSATIGVIDDWRMSLLVDSSENPSVVITSLERSNAN